MVPIVAVIPVISIILFCSLRLWRLAVVIAIVIPRSGGGLDLYGRFCNRIRNVSKAGFWR